MRNAWHVVLMVLAVFVVMGCCGTADSEVSQSCIEVERQYAFDKQSLGENAAWYLRKQYK